MDAFWAQPPISRSITAAVVVLSLLLQCRILAADWFLFYRSNIFSIPFPQIWRLLTPFLITGSGFGLILDPYFLFTYSKLLETGSSRFATTSDYVTYLSFLCGVIIVLAGFCLQSMRLLHALILALVYSYAVENPSQNVQFIVFTVRARYLPICMLFITFVMLGPYFVMLEATGIVAAHLYEFLAVIYIRARGTGSLVQTPQFLRKWFDGRTDYGRSVKVKAYGTAYSSNPKGAGAAGRSDASPASGSPASGWSSGLGLAGSWGNRGTGRRLGGD